MPESALGWTRLGTELVREALAGLDEDAFAAPSALPGWSRKHLTAHLAANADALRNLVHWAATGERTPMYTSPSQRAADIEAGSRRSGDDLRAWFDKSATRLADEMSALTAAHWAAEVVTAQGRTVPASAIPWLRAREVMVHAVDLATGVTFADLPRDFLLALGDDIAAKRSGTGPALVVAPADHEHGWRIAGAGEPRTVAGPLADLVAYLAGRGPARAAVLPAWL